MPSLFHRSSRFLGTALVILYLLSVLPATAADLEKAARALQERDFETAYEEALPLAEQGDETARMIAGIAKLILDGRKREEERLKATGPIDLRDYDERYRPDRSEKEQDQFATGQRLYDAEDYQGALREWLPLAEAGDAEAQFNLGKLYSLGKGVEEDKDRARAYFLKSARQGYGPAQSDLAMSANPFASSKDEASQREAFYWGMRAAANGDYWGYLSVASAYCYGQGVDRNPVLADTWLYLVFSEKDDFLRRYCNDDVELPTPYYDAISERAKALAKAYDIQMLPND